MQDVNKSTLNEKKTPDKNKSSSIMIGKPQTDTSQNKEQSTKDFFRQELLNFDRKFLI